MTESDAREKWCPHAGAIKETKMQTMAMLVIADTSNRELVADLKEVRDGKGQKCIASDCMMWRRTKKLFDAGKGMSEYTPPEAEGDGYCGLAK